MAFSQDRQETQRTVNTKRKDRQVRNTNRKCRLVWRKDRQMMTTATRERQDKNQNQNSFINPQGKILDSNDRKDREVRTDRINWKERNERANVK